MPIAYSYDTESCFALVIASGETQDRDWYEIFNELTNDVRRSEDMNVLMDFSDHKAVVSTEVVHTLINSIERKEGKVKYAFVISREVSLGMANMSRFLLEKKNIEVKTFNNREEAMDWLKKA